MGGIFLDTGSDLLLINILFNTLVSLGNIHTYSEDLLIVWIYRSHRNEMNGISGNDSAL